ncbi:DUF4489 domain-containing protein [Clostridium sp. AL.422]|uniref:DUF4489 domain-containing protein n=1 Tax=Clostridium TaxID=1485 RepID=UPI00293DFF21|nr:MULTISPECIES: DUF4489 domain-containing protein [unclassified Clostridium]MDV4151767.1 DUF4489 domain-containing protein [Clostridium sp. AL.422]
MNSLSYGGLKDELNPICTVNNINIEHGYTGSALIPNGTEVGTSYVISSINVDNINRRLLEFVCNIINNNFIGTISFQVFKLFNNNSNAISIGPPWILSYPAANNGADILSLFVCDEDICSDKCTYIVQATVTDSLFRSLYLTDIVGGIDNVTLVGPATFISNGAFFTINAGIPLTLNIVHGNINIQGLFGSVSQVGNTITVNNIEEGSFIFTESPGFNNISILSGTISLTINPFNGEVIEKSLTSGTSIITNGTLASLSY